MTMNDEIEYETAPALKVLVGREPILDRQQKLMGHEILFRSSSQDTARQLIETTTILEQAAEAGMENLVGSGFGFITATESFLHSESVLFLPQKNFIIILPEVLADLPALLPRVAELRRMGFKFAADHAQLHDPAKAALVPLIEIVRIVLPTPPEMLFLNSDDLRAYKTSQKRLFAQHVHDVTQFEHCMQIGFDYFAGSFYTKPIFVENKKFSASELTIIKVLQLLEQDADDSLMEQAIKQDAVIGLNVLKHVNSAAAGARQRIGSLKQAVQVMGRAQLKRWLQLMLYEKPDSQPSGAALFTLATTRGKLLELLAAKKLPKNRMAPDIGFLVGLISLMDTLFGIPLPEVLQKIPVYNEVSLALLDHKGIYGQLLGLVEMLEQLAQPEPPPQLLPTLAELGLELDEMYELQRQAFMWVNQLQ
jgi:EAL and modified HD-GYP domain-containing signal transduction protein